MFMEQKFLTDLPRLSAAAAAVPPPPATTTSTSSKPPPKTSANYLFRNARTNLVVFGDVLRASVEQVVHRVEAQKRRVVEGVLTVP